MWFFYYFNFERNAGVLKSESIIFAEQKSKLNKSETELEMKKPTHTLRETNYVLQLNENCELKVKL